MKEKKSNVRHEWVNTSLSIIAIGIAIFSLPFVQDYFFEAKVVCRTEISDTYKEVLYREFIIKNEGRKSAENLEIVIQCYTNDSIRTEPLLHYETEVAPYFQ